MEEKNKEKVEQKPEKAEEAHNEAVEHPKSSLKNKLPLIIIIILLLLIIPLGGYFLSNQSNNQAPLPSPTPSPVSSESTPTPTKAATTSAPLSTNLDKTYTSAEHNFQIDYPSGLQTEIRPSSDYFGEGKGIGDVIMLSRWGPTQREATEFYDGLSFSIGVGLKDKNMSLRDFANNETKPDPELGSTREYFRGISVNAINGYEANVISFGENRYIFLPYPNDSAKYYRFFIVSVGPDKETYDEIAEKIIQSFRTTN